MNDIRKKKLESLILRELSGLIVRRRLKDERIGLVSITRVDLARDLSVMTVYISMFGEQKENRITWKALKDNANFFKSTLSRNIRLRVTPALIFEEDETIKEGDRILDIIESERKRSDENPSDDE